MPIRTVLTRSLLTLAAAGVLATTGAAPARAGTYDVRSCSADAAAPPPRAGAGAAATPPRAVTGADDAWQFETNDRTHLESVTQCPPADDSDVDGLIAWTK